MILMIFFGKSYEALGVQKHKNMPQICVAPKKIIDTPYKPKDRRVNLGRKYSEELSFDTRWVDWY